jgi:hypothetical protein
MVLLIIDANHDGSGSHGGYNKTPWVPDWAIVIWMVWMIIIRMIAVVPVPTVMIWRPGIRTVIVMSDYGIMAVVDIDIDIIVIDVDIIAAWSVTIVANIIVTTRTIAIVVIANIAIVAVARSIAIVVIAANIVVTTNIPITSRAITH